MAVNIKWQLRPASPPPWTTAQGMVVQQRPTEVAIITQVANDGRFPNDSLVEVRYPPKICVTRAVSGTPARSQRATDRSGCQRLAFEDLGGMPGHVPGRGQSSSRTG